MGEVRLDEGKAISSSGARQAILSFRPPQGTRRTRCLLRRQPKSETMALVATESGESRITPQEGQVSCND
jgi:hypothetical protein